MNEDKRKIHNHTIFKNKQENKEREMGTERRKAYICKECSLPIIFRKLLYALSQAPCNMYPLMCFCVFT